MSDDSVARERAAVRDYDNASTLNKQKAIGGQVYDNHARDGADFEVPGGTGVDSRLLRLAVSPGESVQVRTPQQRADAAGSDNSSIVVNMFVTTPDPSSFKASQPQIEAKLLRGLRRVGRRN